MDAVIRNAKAFHLPADHESIHTVRQHFHVDGQSGVADPVGRVGAKLEVDVHVIHGHRNRLQNAIRVVKGLQLGVEGIVFNGRAAAMAVLTPEQREMGAMVIDLGAGITEYVVYSNGILKHSGVLAVGGDHVSNDISLGLKIPIGHAERLKIEHGSVDLSAAAGSITVTSDIGLPEKVINLDHMRRIITARLEETFELIDADLARVGLRDHLCAGVFLSGGGMRLSHLAALGEKVFQMPVTAARADSLNGMTDILQRPELNTAIGIVKYGASHQPSPDHGHSLIGFLKKGFGKLIGRA